MFWLLSGCHVFQTLDIPCVAGEPCAAAGEDSGPTGSGEPVTGWILSYDTPDQTAIVENHGPDGATLDAWNFPHTYAGPVTWSIEAKAGLSLDGGHVYDLRPGEDPVYRADVIGGLAPADAERVGDYAWFALGDNVYASNFDVWFKLFDAGLSRADHLARAGGSLYVTAETEAGVDLFAVDVDALTWQPVHQDLNGPRARNVFAGPEDAAYACSAAGAIYALDALAGGSPDTVAFYGGALSDVVDCGYDPGDGRYLLFSPSAGVLKIDARGNGEVLTALPAGYAGSRANFYR